MFNLCSVVNVLLKRVVGSSQPFETSSTELKYNHQPCRYYFKIIPTKPRMQRKSSESELGSEFTFKFLSENKS